MGDCECAACEKCRETMGENALEVYRLRLLLEDVRRIVGTGISIPERLQPQVIWDLADWMKRATNECSLLQPLRAEEGKKRNATREAAPMPGAAFPEDSTITDAQVIDAVRATAGRNGVPAWATTWDIVEHLSAYPPKVVLCKLRSAVKRGIIDGHACSTSPPYCRGDFELKSPP